jgi:DNA-binding NtrC family response regulator
MMARPPRVLVVDDDETFCRLLTEILKGKGMEVSGTTNSLDAYNMSLRQPYDLFILDVRMPLVLGTELAEDIKEEHPTANVILISAFADDNLTRLSEKLGVSLLSKPFSAECLLQEVDKILGRQD